MMYEKLSFRELKKLADKGNKCAQNNLGVRYANGNGIKKNASKAKKYYILAADRCLPQAQFNLGAICENKYDYTTNAVKDYSSAVKWYKLAADQGLAEAQYSLGCMLWKGIGAKKDKHLSILWLVTAARQGHIYAQEHLNQECFINFKN